MIKHSEKKDRARFQILNLVLMMSTTKKMPSDGRPIPNFNEEWSFNSGSGEKTAPIGSLCKLSSAPISKWYLSWLREMRVGEIGTEYLMESIDDGSLCWWSNVSVDWIDKSTTDEYSKLHWTDSYYQFDDMWNKAFHRKNAYVLRAGLPMFHSDRSVTVVAREMFQQPTPGSLEKTFPDYTKVRLKDLMQAYDELYAEMVESKKSA